MTDFTPRFSAEFYEHHTKNIIMSKLLKRWQLIEMIQHKKWLEQYDRLRYFIESDLVHDRALYQILRA